MKKNDLVPTSQYNSQMNSWNTGSLKNSSGQIVNSRPQAQQVAAFNSNQSFNDKRKSDMQTIIPSSTPAKVVQVPKMQKYVQNRKAGAADHAQTKLESAKKHNAEFFKKQSDRKFM